MKVNFNYIEKTANSSFIVVYAKVLVYGPLVGTHVRSIEWYYIQ